MGPGLVPGARRGASILVMSKLQYLGILAACAGGAALGSSILSRPATAQIPPQPPPINQEMFIVPNNGLRFVNERGRVVAMVTSTQGVGGFMLFGLDGQPSVSIEAARSGGRVVIRALEEGAEIQLGSEEATARTTLNAGRTISQLVLKRSGGRAGFSATAQSDGAFVSLAGPENETAAAISPGRVALSSKGRVLVDLFAEPQGGKATLQDAQSQVRAELTLENLALKKGKDTLWQAIGAGG